MIDVDVVFKDGLVLDFDIECRPLAWYGGDFVTKQPTAIAWQFIGQGRINVAVIGESDRSSLILQEETEMIEAFRKAYDKADMVTGHYIRNFDLPVLNGACMRLGLPMLRNKLSQDTKLDFAKRSGMSTSQENLGAMFELAHPKVGMNTTLWAMGNMLLPEGIRATRKRAMGDVRQHIELREKMLAINALASPRVWSSSGTGVGGYHS